MLTDLYQLTMMQGYWRSGMRQNEGIFDLFFRKRTDVPVIYAIMAGLEQVVEYIDNIRFSREDIAYLGSLGIFDEDFLEALETLRFTGEMYAVPEGTPVFPGEPLVRVRAPMMEAQLIETTLLNIINHQTLIATKASRVVYAAGGGAILEFGLRRAQGPDAGLYGARAAMIGGCAATSNVMAGELFDVPVKGTHAHSWVMSFPDELSAFRAYAQVFPDACMLLVDTYNTLKSGVPNAITVFRELREKGYEPVGIRLDSGDLAYLSKQARLMMDDAGFPNAQICASGDLDETVIWDLRAQGAAIDSWGVGTKLITSENIPALGGVYKLSAEVVDGKVVPKIKVSENPEKVTNPGYKKVFRIYDKATGAALADLITLEDEVIDETKPLHLFDPVNTWKEMYVEDFTAKELLEPVYIGGRRIHRSKSVTEIQAYHKQQMKSLWDEYLRINNPHVYKVDLSHKLYDLKQALLKSEGKRGL
ncbi:MAG: nicotinate phosphoribosyltransferase [Christensenellales bacterium]